MTTGLRILLAALRCEKGAVEANLAAHEAVLAEAAAVGCAMAVFPEMSLTGSVDPAIHPERLVGLDHPAVQHLVHQAQALGVAAVFGIAEAPGPSITQIYTCSGWILGVQRKRHLGEGEEAFVAAEWAGGPGRSGGDVFQFGSVRFGMAICAEARLDRPFDDAAAAGAQLMIFSAAPGLHGRRTSAEDWRSGLEWWESCGLGDARRHAARTGLWIALATQAGSTEDEDFPGLAALVAPDGTVADRLPDEKPGTLVVELPLAPEVEPMRQAARVLLLDDEDRVLLVCFTDVKGDQWWTAPGGGLEPGESHIEAARRELAEELGRSDIEIGPAIGRRTHTMYFNGGPWMTQSERWFAARCPPFAVDDSRREHLAAENVTDVRWWPVDELAAAVDRGTVVAPRRLVALVRQIIEGQPPRPDTDLGV